MKFKGWLKENDRRIYLVPSFILLNDKGSSSSSSSNDGALSFVSFLPWSHFLAAFTDLLRLAWTDFFVRFLDFCSLYSGSLYCIFSSSSELGTSKVLINLVLRVDRRSLAGYFYPETCPTYSLSTVSMGSLTGVYCGVCGGSGDGSTEGWLVVWEEPSCLTVLWSWASSSVGL